jgi:hypothetical protein
MSAYASLTREQLARLVPELLLCGQLIDRSAMAWCIEAWGREEMALVAIEEWTAASPIYTKRMQRALRFEGDDVITIFKGLQLDIGAPPQFMDFRYTVHDRWHGEFHLDHCGALMDVEPMGPKYVRSMCHDIEDPTFDATAIATNARAQVRPIHRPPRIPADRKPHCAWTVLIEPEHPKAELTDSCRQLQDSRAATLALAPINRTDPGAADYAGPLLSDLAFTAFSRSALIRLADEVALQMQLLSLAFRQALDRRADPDQAQRMATKQLVGIAGLTAERLHRALGSPPGVTGALRVLQLHPMLNPAAYVFARPTRSGLSVSRSPGHEDGGWPVLYGPGSPRPLQAVVRAVDPRLDVRLDGDSTDWTLEIVTRDQPADQPADRPAAQPGEFEEVAITRFSTGAQFRFHPRRSLPITPITPIGPGTALIDTAINDDRRSTP